MAATVIVSDEATVKQREEDALEAVVREHAACVSDRVLGAA